MTPPRPAALPDHADEAFRAYFTAARPDPWPWPTASRVATAAPAARPARRPGAARSRLTLAVSAALLLAGALALTPPRDHATPGPAAAPGASLHGATADGKGVVKDLRPAKAGRK